jgi:hypothetical protein
MEEILDGGISETTFLQEQSIDQTRQAFEQGEGAFNFSEAPLAYPLSGARSASGHHWNHAILE